MSAKLVLYFTATGHALYRWARGQLELEATFAGDEAGLEQFRGHFKGRKGALVHVLADVTGEDFHEDQIPYLRGGDRLAVVQRRLAQRYRDTRLAAALSLGPTGGERRGERLLLASFANTQQFTGWIDVLAESGARLSGVYSVPLLAPALAARLGVRGGQALVVTANATGLRQCYIEDGRLRFARLEPVAEIAPQALPEFVRVETLRLVQYLATLKAMTREGPPIQVLLVVPAAQRAAFEKAFVSDARLAYHTVTLEEAAKKTGVRQLPAGAGGEHLFLHLAVKRPPAEPFARVEDRRSYVLWRLQRAITTAGAIGFAACAVFAAYKGIDVLGLREQAAEQRRQARDASQQHQRITASFPVTQTTPDNLKATVVEFTRIASQSASPEAALVYVSRALEKFPQMELDSVLWRMSKSGDSGAAGGKPPATAPGGEMMQVLEISGRVNTIRRSEYRAITAQVQRFAESLRGDPAWRMLRTVLPFDITSEGTLSGDIGSAEGGEAPRFTVIIGRGVK